MPTFLHQLKNWEKENPNWIAQSFKSQGVWKPITVKTFCERVYWIALFLESQGMTSKDILTLFSFNCPAWVHADLGALLLGAKTAGIYPNASPKDVAFVLQHTESRFLAVQNQRYLKKIQETPEGKEYLHQFKLILVFEPESPLPPQGISYEDACQQGKLLASSGKSYEQYLENLNPHDPAFIIYTSGTTGKPKGALLSHDNFVSTIQLGIQFWGLKVPKEEKEQGRIFSFLPLCHVAETVHNLGAGILLRHTVYFCSSFEHVSLELPEVQPTLLLCVPRIWEKMMEAVLSKTAKKQGISKKVLLWGLATGFQLRKQVLFSKKLTLLERMRYELAEKLVLNPIKRALGLQKATLLVSGAAPLGANVKEWFQGLGLEIIEDFGQTESTGIICMTKQGENSGNTAGKPVPGLEVKLAEDGEILTRGVHVFQGYLNDPKATKEVLQDHWLHTGDLGTFNDQGSLRIVGRKKEILKTSGGKQVAPLALEEEMKQCPMVSQACIIGDGRKHIAALLTLHPTALESLSKPASDPIITLPEILEPIQMHINKLNATLSSFEQIKKFVVLAKEFSIESGEITPTLKLKRKVIEEHYQSIVQSIYS
jgi:long-chain acyl-CoA synthetase